MLFTDTRAIEITLLLRKEISRSDAVEIVKDSYDTWIMIAEILMSQHQTLSVDEALSLVVGHSDKMDGHKNATCQILEMPPNSEMGIFFRKFIKTLCRKHTTLTMEDWFIIAKMYYELSKQ
jgi:hypothetical protein